MKRIEALEVLAELTAQHPVVVTCAATSRELASVKDSDNHLYLLDSMGLVGSVMTGLALGRDASLPKVVGLEGDGSLLMNPNVLPTGGYLKPEMLMVLLDNEVYGSTAGLPTYSSEVNVEELAAAAGWATGRAPDQQSLRSEYARLLQVTGRPGFLHVPIEAGNAAEIPKLLIDPVRITHRFSRWLASADKPSGSRETVAE
ncbi:thiamine pyrophosphate-dependent enzyme [Nesterenkonia muleiensis]|uniref:thiamine pyrophosphate-dependent enzyme n=1 Tax=Nesterenkonia muleiensis TaxID=2282648 RepID=UPI000E768DEA|nr:thiamine pyrophosphate-dependent enzyme [Nesterenkonia muleiensis]